VTLPPAPVLWAPSSARTEGARIHAFASLARGYGAPPAGAGDYRALHAWSIHDPGAFWSAVWAFAGVIGEGGGEDSGGMAAAERAVEWPRGAVPPGVPEEGFDPAWRPRWFPHARLNFAENLLQAPDEAEALVGWTEDGRTGTLTFGQLRHEVARFATALRARGVVPGDRVAAVLPNVPETVIAFLGTAAVGAVWSSSSPDFGTGAVVDRFAQIEPRVLLVTDGYQYKGRTFDQRDRVAGLRARLPSVECVVRVAATYAQQGVEPGGTPPGSDRGGDLAWEHFLAAGGPPLAELREGRAPFLRPRYERLPFDHPLAILYSSGTTGLPKGIVHSAGGTLLQHRKEHLLHVDLRAGDRFFYFTTCGWMMWNWLVSGLAEGATLILYDGAPALPDAPDLLWALAEAERVQVMGVSARYIALMEKEGVRPGATRDLTPLRTLLSTGSPLPPAGFRWVYREVASDVHLASISGGTDILSCFMLGVPTLPVHEGEIQGAGLGMAVEIRDEEGRPCVGSPGELVCTRPFPSMPIGFWNDPGHVRFRAAYFERIPGVWCHGDWAEETGNGGFVIHGRSDATLNPGGVRLGTAEIYRQVEGFPEVLEAVAAGQDRPGGEVGDVRIVLLVRLRDGALLTPALESALRRAIREHASPHHVPEVIAAVPDLPRTLSGKLSEIAVRDALNGRASSNADALANPEALQTLRALVTPRLPAPLAPLMQGVVDYAGLFPPAALAMGEAVAKYAEYRRGGEAAVLGRFVVPVARLAEFEAAWGGTAAAGDAPWELSAILGEDLEAEAPAIAAFHARTGGRARIVSLEARVASAEDVDRVAALFPPTEGMELWLELPAPVVADAAARAPLLDRIQAVGAFAKLRTGGVTASLFPAPETVGGFLRACVQRGLRFKATAGLHHPLRGEYPLTYAPDAPRGVMFGYLNILLATAVLRAGGSDEEALAALIEEDAGAMRVDQGALSWGRFRLSPATLHSLRQDAVAGFGSCSFEEPVGELGALLARFTPSST